MSPHIKELNTDTKQQMASRNLRRKTRLRLKEISKSRGNSNIPNRTPDSEGSRAVCMHYCTGLKGRLMNTHLVQRPRSLLWFCEFLWVWAGVYLAINYREADSAGARGTTDGGCPSPGLFLGLGSPSSSPDLL